MEHHTFIREERMALTAILFILSCFFAGGWVSGLILHSCPVVITGDGPMKKAWEDTSTSTRSFAVVEKESPGRWITAQKFFKRKKVKDFGTVVSGGDTIARPLTDSTMETKPFTASDSIEIGNGHKLRTEFSMPPVKWRYNFYEAPDSVITVTKIFTQDKIIQVDKPPELWWEVTKAVLCAGGGAYIGYSLR